MAVLRPRLNTDFSDYAPGSTVNLTLDGFTAGEEVTFQAYLVDPGADGIMGTADDLLSQASSGVLSWTVIDGGSGDMDGVADGVISTTWYVDPVYANTTIEMVATTTSGDTASVVFTDTPPIPIDAVPATLADGTKFIAEGSPTGGSTGTGVINSFLGIQNSSIEQGYNTDGSVQLDTQGGGHTHSITLAEIPVVTIAGSQYRQFRLDLNEDNSSNHQNISLDRLQIWSASSATLINFNPSGAGNLPAGNLIWDMDGTRNTTVNLFDWNTGSGKGDYSINIPVAYFAGVSGNPFIYVYGQFGDPVATNQGASDGGFEEFYVVTKAAPSIAIAKTAAIQNDSATIGALDNTTESVNYTITLTNNGNVALTSVVLNDTIEGYSLAPLGVPGAPGTGVTSILESGDGTHGNTTLDIGETWTYTLHYQETAADLTRERSAGQNLSIHNTASVTANSSGGIVSGSASADVPVTVGVVPHGELTIVKAAAVADGVADEVGDVINYTIEVANAGAAEIANVTVDDNFITDLSAPSGDTDADGKLDVGEIWTYTGSHTVTQAELDAGGTIDNTATAHGTGVDDVSDSAHVPVEQHPSLTIEKTAAEASVDAAGQVIHYTIAVDNTGNVDLTNVSLDDSNIDAGSLSGPTGDDGDGVLETNETWSYTATHTVTQAEMNAGADIVNIGTVDTQQTAPQTDDATTKVVQHPSLTIEKTAAEASVDAAGQVIHYTIAVDNTGNVDLTNVSLDDSNIDAGSLSGPTGDDGDGVLETNETWSYTATHTVTQAEMNAGADIVNIGTVDTQQTAPQTDDATTKVVQHPSLTIEKTAAEASVDAAGQVIHYTIAVDNTGNVDLTNVSLDDSNIDAGSLSGPTGDDGDGVLETNETWSYTATHTVTQAEMNAGADIVNIGTVDTQQTAPQTDDATTKVVQKPNFKIEKDVISITGGTPDGKVDNAGDVINYGIVLTNTGNMTLTGVILGDPFATSVSGPIKSGGTGSNSNGKLDVGETWTYSATHLVTQAEIDAGANLVNVANGDTDQTGPKSDDATTSVVRFVPGPGGLTPGFWAQHFEAWNGVSTDDAKTLKTLVAQGVLTKADVELGLNNDGRGAGVLLGDANGDGKTDNGEMTLFVPLAAAQQIINSSDTATDTRQILMKHAIAAQLNILNGDKDPGYNAGLTNDNTVVGTDMISRAVQWLRGQDPFIYSGSTGNVDQKGTAGVLDIGMTNGATVDYNTKTQTFNSTVQVSSGQEWQLGKDIDPSANVLKLDGEGLKNILMEFNQNQLVTSKNGSQVAWNTGSGYIDVHLNGTLDYLKVAAGHGAPLT